MKTVIEDTWFPETTRIRVSAGTDELVFLECSFHGGEIFVEHGIERTIFSRCIFHGTSCGGQPLSERIASECRNLSAETEAPARPTAVRHAKFRR
jgi:hypothetical protein